MDLFIKIVKSKTICFYHPIKLVSLIESARDFDIDFQFTEYIYLHCCAIIITANVYCSRKLLWSFEKKIISVTVFPLSHTRNVDAIYYQLLTDVQRICTVLPTTRERLEKFNLVRNISGILWRCKAIQNVSKLCEQQIDILKGIKRIFLLYENMQ